MKPTHPSGMAAEQAALLFLEQQGCELIERNWHCPYGEIDLIVRQNGVWLFIEVKYRKNRFFGGAMYSITPQKMAKLQRSVEYYLQSYPNTPCRLDAVLIEGNQPPIWIHNITG